MAEWRIDIHPDVDNVQHANQQVNGMTKPGGVR
jgi:hypothetical protein